MKNKVIYLAVHSLLAMICSFAVANAQEQPTNYAFLDEHMLRERAIKNVMPIYPENVDLAKAQGMVIVIVQFNDEGKLFKLKTLESPHPALTEAVEEAIRQWEIKPPIVGGIPRLVQSELRFNFIAEDGTRRVGILPFEEQIKSSPQYKKADLEFRPYKRKKVSNP